VEYLCSNAQCNEEVDASGGLCAACATSADTAGEVQPAAQSTRSSASVAKSLPGRLATLELNAPGWEFAIVASNLATREAHVRHSANFATMAVLAPLIHVFSRAPHAALRWMAALRAPQPNHKQVQTSRAAMTSSLGEAVWGRGVGWCVHERALGRGARGRRTGSRGRGPGRDRRVRRARDPHRPLPCTRLPHF